MKKEQTEALMRIVVGIVALIILGVWKCLIIVLGIVNFFVTLFTTKRNRDLAEFSEYWNTECYRFHKYMTFVTNERPFPFTNMRRFSRFRR